MLHARLRCLKLGFFLVKICDGDLLKILAWEKLLKLQLNPLLILKGSSSVPSVQTIELSKDG